MDDYGDSGVGHDSDLVAPQRMPQSVLIPVGLYWIIGVFLLVSGMLNIFGLDRVGAGVFLASVGVACVVAAIGLHRRWGPALLVGYLLAILLALSSLSNVGVAVLVIPLAAGLGWALSVRSTREWMGS